MGMYMESSLNPAANVQAPSSAASANDESLLLVVPCYNEQESITLFYQAIVNVRRQLPCELSLIFVDDGSKDASLDIMRNLADKDLLVHYISFSRNFGKEAAMYAGLRNAAKGSSTYVGVIDVDLQDPPELIPKMVRTIQETGCDSVAAFRSSRDGEGCVRSFYARMFYKLSNHICDVKIVEGARDFRIMNRRMLDAVVSVSEHVRFSKGIFAWVGFDTRWVGFKNVKREHGKSKWRFRSLVSYAFEGIASFSSAPVRMMVSFGFCMVAFSLLLLIVMGIYSLVTGTTLHRILFGVLIIMLFAGLQLLCSGIVGLYVVQTYTEAQARPPYIVREER
jgi:glycosyltransferase involved in cell wall biosynthesis